MFKPPRPQINKQIIEAAAEVFVRENIDSLPEYLESEDLVEHLVKHFARHKDGFELAKDLECEGWDITAETVQLLDEFDIQIEDALQDAEKEWIKTNNIQPPLKIGTEVEYMHGGMKKGTITGISQYRVGCYEIKENGWDDEKNGQVRHLVKWECTRKIEMCSTMNRPRTECGCPDCGSSLTEYNE